jgi:hypothetical protein
MSKRTLFAIALAVVVSLLAWCLPAAAQQSGREAMFQDWMSGFQQDLLTAQQTLAGKAQSEWTQEEIEAYLFNALFAIYNADNLYVERNRQHPSDAQVLQDSGILSPWPGNPFNDWQPISWSSGSGEFSPGDIVLQLCPPEWYSGYDRLIPLTFVMSINGPAESYTPLQSADTFPIEPIYDWDIVPPGTVFMTTSYFEPAAKTRAKVDAAKAAKARRAGK